MQNSEKRESAEKNSALMDKMYASLKYCVGVSILFLIIDYLTSGGGWSLWVIGIWGSVLAVQWFKMHNRIK